MRQTPVHEHHNPDLLRLIPSHVTHLIEIGCSAGALVRELKIINSGCHCIGVEIDPEYAKLASRYCDEVISADIEQADEAFFSSYSDRECWVFGDSLEHLKDPWSLLGRVRDVIPPDGCVVACVPNVQHWSVIARLCIGDFRYAENGLLDRTHLRWFTRQTIIEMFLGAGFEIVQGVPRIFDEPERDKFLCIIGDLAKASGADPDVAMNDAIPVQYVVRAIPK